MNWKTTWGYLPVNYNTAIGTVENITQRTFFWNNLNGEKVRIKFSNRYGLERLCLERVVIGQKERNANRITAITTITYGGKEVIEIPPGAEFYSDEKEWKIAAGTEIVISIYIREKSAIRSACSTWSARSWHSVYGLHGDYTMEQQFSEKQSRDVYPYVKEDVNKANIAAGISEISLYTKSAVKTVVIFGDSITHMSYYSDALTEKVYRSFPGKVTILNRGIGGNRILRDATFVKDMPGEGKCFGTAAVKRFERDVYETERPEYIFFLEGVNDMLHPEFFQHPEEDTNAVELAEGLLKIIETAHQRGSRIYAGTVMPFKNDAMEVCTRAERIRREFNKWIREQRAADGIFDFSKHMEKCENSEYMKEDLHIGDGLHPNIKGGCIMANVVWQKEVKKWK